MNHDGITVTAMLLLGAFAVDRVASAVTFLAFRPGTDADEIKNTERKSWNRKVIYFVVASVIAVVILIATEKVRLLAAMGMLRDSEKGFDVLVDWVLTFLVLVGGAEKISNLLGSPSAGGSEEKQEPVQLEGVVRVEPTTDSSKAKGIPA
jgi:hypothetical protein